MFRKIYSLGALIIAITFSLVSCNYMTSPIAPYIASAILFLESRDRTLQEINIIEPKQLATINTIAISKIEVLDVLFEKQVIKIFEKDFSMPGKVVPFYSEDNGQIITDLLETYFLKYKIVDVVERSKLKTILQEQTIMQSGIAGDKIHEIIAATAGADALLVGNWGGLGYIPYKSPMPFFAAGFTHLKLIDTRNGMEK